MTDAEIHLALFWIGSLIGIPLAVILGRLYQPFLYVIFGLLVVVTVKWTWSITFFSHEEYRSATRGLEIQLADLLAIILAISMLLRPKEFRIRWLLPMMIPYFLFLLMGLITWFSVQGTVIPNTEADELMQKLRVFDLGIYPLFELSKVVRTIFLYWVTANFMAADESVNVLCLCIAGLLIYVTLGGLVHRYVFGEYRVSVAYLNVNDFNAYVGLLGAFLFPFAFSTKRWWLSIGVWALVGCGFVTIVLTVSRSSLAGYVFACAVVLFVSLLRYPSKRNFLMCCLAALCALSITVKAYNTLMERFSLASAASDLQFRYALNDIAVNMARDHPLGVGLGNYMAFSATQYATFSTEELRTTIAHNMWYLTLGEMGWIGLLLLAVIWLRFFQMVLSGLFRARHSRLPNAFSVLLGALAASIVMQVQNLVHYSFRQTSVLFLMTIIMGAAARAYLDLRTERRRLRAISTNRGV